MRVLARNLKVLVAAFLLLSAVLFPFSGVVGAQVGNATNATGTNTTNVTGADALTGKAASATNASDPQLGALISNNSTSSVANGHEAAANGTLTNNSNTTNTTTNSSVVNGHESNSSANGGGGGSCGVTNPADCIPTVQDIIGGAIEYVVGGFTEHLKGFVQSFSNILVGLPAPGDGWDVSTWSNPQDGWWPGIYKAYAVFSAISVSLLGLAFMFAYETTDPYRQRKRLKRIAVHAIMILFGAVIIIPASLHFFDTLAQSLAPSANEFFSTPGDISKLGIGMILGGGLVFAQSSIILVGISVLLAIFVALHFLVAFWPLFWVARLAPVSSVEWVGNAGIAAFYAVCVMRVLQSGFLRVLFELPWKPVTAGASSAVAAVLMTIIGLYGAFIWMPRAFSKKAIPGVQMLSSQGPSSEEVREGYKQSRRRMGNLKQRFEQARSSGTDGSTTPAHKREGSTSNFQSRAYTGSGNSPSGNVGEVASSSNRSRAGNSGGSSSSSLDSSSQSSDGVNAGTWDDRRYKARKAARRGHR